uniref:VAN3-binding protein-like auxin canalisation domain-containing protein n=1 Tax=Setaria viridis TaxID=4556 RepID=A0A4U6TTQ3_SETVI|nr:hypothetical protein SEVIR_7G242050v2 [Setaria viridis]
MAAGVSSSTPSSWLSTRWDLFMICFLSLDHLDASPTSDMNTSPPANMSAVMIRSWPLENTSISTADMLDTVAADTAVKNMSMPRGLPWGARTLSAERRPHPAQERATK